MKAMQTDTNGSHTLCLWKLHLKVSFATLSLHFLHVPLIISEHKSHWLEMRGLRMHLKGKSCGQHAG